MIGPWPSPPPFEAPARAALWLDGSLESATAAYLLSHWQLPWVALRVGSGSLAEPPGVEAVDMATETPFTRPSGWGAACEAAIALGAAWLVTGATDDGEYPPLPLRMAAAETAVRAYGLQGIWAPLLGYTPIEVGRLALALGVPRDLMRDPRLLRELGMDG